MSNIVQVQVLSRAPSQSEFRCKGRLWNDKHNAFYRVQQEVARNAGIQWKQNALRHTCISARVALTRDVPAVAYESGNSVAVIKKHYLDLMEPSVAQAWFDVTPLAVLKYQKERSQAAKETASSVGCESPSVSIAIRQ